LSRCRSEVKKLGLWLRCVENNLTGRRIDSVIGSFSIEQIIGKRNPLCLFVLVGAVDISGDIKIPRSTIGIFTIVD
jgi:hypothetical protein